MTLSVRLAAPNDRKVVLKNVIGILRGSDPVLKNTCVLVTAHYDHIGTGDTAGPMAVSLPKDMSDWIYNGANDDGSGTVSVIEIARAMARLNPRPRRSIVFMTFFGEELGEVGAKFYASHPIFPPDKTVADLNLEQLGRTDSASGPQIGTVTMTGYGYSDLSKFLEQAGRETGIKIYEDKEDSDEYFVRSDNEALARIGIPAHTIAVAYEFPDYHAVGDEWQKIDYGNMAKVDRMIALAVWNLANSLTAPQWNADNPKAEPFRKVRGNIQ
jgi:Zn-dependent M28 family amino/carboxypeptidase